MIDPDVTRGFCVWRVVKIDPVRMKAAVVSDVCTVRNAVCIPKAM